MKTRPNPPALKKKESAPHGREKKYAFIRFFDEEEHARQFLSGKIRIGKVRYYRDQEEKNGRGDKNEGNSTIYSGQDTKMKLSCLEGKEYDISDGLLSIKLAHHVDLDSHITLCKYNRSDEIRQKVLCSTNVRIV